MFFNARQAIMAATAILGVADALIGDCQDGPWNLGNVQWTGGPGGEEFCVTKHKEGVVITGIEIYASAKAVESLQFFFSDGTNSPQFGLPENTRVKERMDWDPSTDGLSQVKTWGNGRGQDLGRIFMRTKSGKEIDVGKDTSGQQTFEHNVESGILMGAFGANQDVINNLGLLFLRSKIATVTVTDVVFKDTPEELNKRKEGLDTVVLDYADHTNNLPDATEIFTFGKSEQRMTSKRYSTTATHTFGISEAFKVSGKVFGLGADATTTLGYSYANTETEDSSTTKSVTLTYTVATNLSPGQRVFCRALAMSGVYNGDFTSTVNIALEDGTIYSFAQGGTMEQTQWSQASSVCQDGPFDPTPDVPSVPKRGVKFSA